MEGSSGRLPAAVVALAAAVSMVAIGCAGTESAPTEQQATGEKPAAAEREAWRAEFDRRREELRAYWRPPSQEPKVKVPEGPPPRRLVIKDLRIGTGPPLRWGREGIVNSVTYTYETGIRSDTNYERGLLPNRVVPGRGDLIRGFERGVVGMRAGGRRQLIVPPRLAYGQRGYLPHVRPGETLIYVVDLEHVYP